jgi:hypothetical protein
MHIDEARLNSRQAKVDQATAPAGVAYAGEESPDSTGQGGR